MIRLLDLPGARELEARMKLLPEASPSSDEVMRARLGRLAGFLGYELDDWCRVRVPEGEQYEPLEIDDAAFDDQIGFWKQRGWDITDEGGDMLHCYPQLLDAMACIEIGIGGASRVQIEAAIWQARKERQREEDPARRRQNDNFLQLGGRRRKGA